MQLNTVQTLIRIELPLSDTCQQVFKYIYIWYFNKNKLHNSRKAGDLYGRLEWRTEGEPL